MPFKGTLIFDEADFRFSDREIRDRENFENGNVRGLPVLRTLITTSASSTRRPSTYLAPKIVATRGSYDDKGLESRFITEEMGSRQLRSDIPITSLNFKDGSARASQQTARRQPPSTRVKISFIAREWLSNTPVS
jgi:hypothetical protein